MQKSWPIILLSFPFLNSFFSVSNGSVSAKSVKEENASAELLNSVCESQKKSFQFLQFFDQNGENYDYSGTVFDP